MLPSSQPPGGNPGCPAQAAPYWKLVQPLLKLQGHFKPSAPDQLTWAEMRGLSALLLRLVNLLECLPELTGNRLLTTLLLHYKGSMHLRSSWMGRRHQERAQIFLALFRGATLPSIWGVHQSRRCFWISCFKNVCWGFIHDHFYHRPREDQHLAGLAAELDAPDF